MRRLRLPSLAAFVALLLLSGWVADAEAATLQQVGRVFVEPMFVTSPPAEPNRLFVAERPGKILQVEGGRVRLLADVRSAVDCCRDTRGLQSIAVSPEFAKTGAVFLDYTNAAGNVVIAEMRVEGRMARLATLRTVLTIPYSAEANHYGGQIQFGPEGNLFISTGDGGYGGRNDEHHNAQSLERLQGKILRIDPSPDGLIPYAVPPDNPFRNLSSPYDTIWSSGLRNPYRFSFHRRSRTVVISDVGELQREEVDMLPIAASAGANFGWNCREGSLPGAATDPECTIRTATDFTSPIFEYGHDDPGDDGAWGCAIIGGYIVRDRSVSGLFGRFVYADYCNATIRSFNPSTPQTTDRSEGIVVPRTTAFGEDSCGRVYVVSLDGTVSRISSGKPAKCGKRIRPRLRLRVPKKSVARGARALIVTWVKPCRSRRGGRMFLYRGARRVGSTRLNAKCGARFHPPIARPGTYRVKIRGNKAYRAALSRPVRIRVQD